MSTLSIEELVARNASYAKSHQPILLSKSGPPTVLIISCADPRVLPAKFLELSPVEAITIQNVAGRITDYVIQEIVTTDTFVGNGIKNLIIIHHTDCGGAHFTTETIKQSLNTRVPNEDLADFRTGSFEGKLPKETVMADIDVVKKSPLIRQDMKANVIGLVYDIETGLLTSAFG